MTRWNASDQPRFVTEKKIGIRDGTSAMTALASAPPRSVLATCVDRDAPNPRRIRHVLYPRGDCTNRQHKGATELLRTIQKKGPSCQKMVIKFRESGTVDVAGRFSGWCEKFRRSPRRRFVLPSLTWLLLLGEGVDTFRDPTRI